MARLIGEGADRVLRSMRRSGRASLPRDPVRERVDLRERLRLPREASIADDVADYYRRSEGRELLMGRGYRALDMKNLASAGPEALDRINEMHRRRTASPSGVGGMGNATVAWPKLRDPFEQFREKAWWFLKEGEFSESLRKVREWCNTPDAPIWMADGTFKPIGEVRVGDEVMGWTWERRGPKGHWRRYLTPTKVEATNRRQAPMIVEVEMESGRTVRCTPDHKWANYHYSPAMWQGEPRKGRTREYRPAEVGLTMVGVIEPLEPLADPKEIAAAGYLAGIIDGEGHVDRAAVSVAQSPTKNPRVCARIEEALTVLGIEYSVGWQESGGKLGDGVNTYTVTQGRAGLMKLVNWVPSKKVREAWKYSQTRWTKGWREKVAAIRELGAGEVVSMQTGTGNYIAWGFASSNCRLVYMTHPLMPSLIDIYCLAGETQVVTWDGTRSIKELAGTKQRVLTTRHKPTDRRRGGGVSRWVDAEFSSFGEQRLWKITLTRWHHTKEIYATEAHRWFARRHGDPARDYQELTTVDLRPGDLLRPIRPRNEAAKVHPSPIAQMHGIVYGDGAYGANGESYVDLHEEKNAALLPLFGSHRTGVAGGRASGCCGRGACVRVLGLPGYFKRLPDKNESASYLYGWISGYFAADGRVTKAGQVTLSSSVAENLQFVRDLALKLGIGTWPIVDCGEQETILPDGVRRTCHMWTLTFDRATLSEEFFLVEEHRRRWLAAGGRGPRKSQADGSVGGRPADGYGWKVVSVEPTDRVEEVYCAVVPESECFALEDDILTGNSRFPLLDIEFSHPDPQLSNFYNDLFLNELDYQEFLYDASREFWCVGEFFALGSWHDGIGAWDADELLNPDDVVVSRNSVLRQYQFHLKVPEGIKKLIETRQPREEYEMLVRFYPYILQWAQQNTEIPVSDVLLKQLKFKCVVGSTPVMTPRGPVPAQDLQVGDEVVSWDWRRREFATSRVSHTGVRDPEPIYWVTTKSGRKVGVTRDHPFWTKQGWVMAEDLVPGDELLAATEYPLEDGGLDADVARFLGLMVGDGSCQAGSPPQFHNADGTLVEWIDGFVSALGCRARPIKNKAGSYSLSQEPGATSAYPNPVSRLLVEHGLLGSNTYMKRVPSSVWAGGPKARAAFLSGYFDTDGYFDRRRGLVVWDSANRALLEDCQGLLAAFGVPSRIDHVQHGDAYRLTVGKRFLADVAEIMSPMVPRKALPQGTQYSRRGLAQEQADYARRQLSEGRTGRSVAAELGVSEQVVSLIKAGKTYARPSAAWDVVRLVEVGDPEPTVALGIAEYRTHVTAGLVTHNTNPWEPHGVPIGMRAFKTLMLEMSLEAAQDAVADRLYSPLILANLGIEDVGDGEGPWIPEPEEIDALRDDIALALMSDFRLMCQPPGTMVAVVRNARRPAGGRGGSVEPEYAEVPIESVRPGQRVLSYSRNGERGSRLTKFGNVVTRAGSRPFDGELVSVKGEGLASRYTPDHVCLVRVGDAFLGKHLVYLMRRGNQFRVGMTSPSRAAGHPGAASPLRRFAAEGADALWVLGAYSSKVEAHKVEFLTSYRYGIPQLRFSEPGRYTIDLDEFWEEFGDNVEGGVAALAAFGRDVEWPLYSSDLPPRQRSRLTRGHMVEMRACNLMDGMEVLRIDGYREAQWIPVMVGREPYSGPVYSMDVERNHTYVADGVVTHNCYHHGLQIQSVFGREVMPRLDLDFERVDMKLMQIFGIGPELLQGGKASAPYASGALNRELITQMLSTYQVKLKQFLRERMEVVAERQGHFEFEKRGTQRFPVYETVLMQDELTGEEYVVEKPKLALPEVRFRSMNLRDETVERQFLLELRASGVPISDGTLVANLPIEFGEETDKVGREKMDKVLAELEYQKRLFMTIFINHLPVPPEYAVAYMNFVAGIQGFALVQGGTDVTAGAPAPNLFPRESLSPGDIANAQAALAGAGSRSEESDEQRTGMPRRASVEGGNPQLRLYATEEEQEEFARVGAREFWLARGVLDAVESPAAIDSAAGGIAADGGTVVKSAAKLGYEWVDDDRPTVPSDADLAEASRRVAGLKSMDSPEHVRLRRKMTLPAGTQFKAASVEDLEAEAERVRSIGWDDGAGPGARDSGLGGDGGEVLGGGDEP